MRQIVAIAVFSFGVILGAHAADNDEIQQGIFDSYLKLANQGDVVAQYIVAQRYENGKGTEKNPEKAQHWYEMAAKQNYPLAVVRIEEQKKQRAIADLAAAKPAAETPAPTAEEAPVNKAPAKKPVALHKEAPRKETKEAVAKPKAKMTKTTEVATAAAPVQTAKPKPTEPANHPDVTKQEAKATPPQEVVVAKAPVVEEPPKPPMNVTQVLLAGKWKRNQQDAEFLPSSHAACLQSGNAEVVCFSQELTRNADNAGLTYSVKSVISGINNREAKFNLRYIYNVVQIASKPFAQPNGMSGDVNDMIMKTGWQEPGVSMECIMRDERSLTCTRADRKMTYQFARE